MAKQTHKEANKEVEAEVWSAILAFEQILEAMPNDKDSLFALADAYEQLGDQAKARHYLLRLAGVLADEGDAAGATEVAPKVRKLAENGDAEAQAVLDRLEGLRKKSSMEEAAPAGRVEGPAKEKKAGTAGFNIGEELALAWNLMEAGELTQEEYASVVQDLTEMSASESVVTISVLHVLESRAFKNFERILAHISKSCGTPIIKLSAFELQAEALSMLPLEFMIRRGILPFDVLGRDLLAVIMNPYERQVQKEVEAMTKRKCHFFLTLPSEFDAALARAQDILSEKAKSPAE